jgi:hypothetical protein
MTHRFLQGLKEDLLTGDWTPERSEIVDRIDQMEDDNEVHDPEQKEVEGIARRRFAEMAMPAR